MVQQAYMSLDPAMRGWMDDDRDSYIPPVEIGETMRSMGVGIVVESQNPNWAVGTRVAGMFGWTQHYLSRGNDLNVVPDQNSDEDAMGLFGLAGATAYHGLIEQAQPKPGETLLISGAAGAVGSLVGQLGKAEKLRVIGIVGSNEKANWLKTELGFDDTINYNTENIPAKLSELCPRGIDIYYENVGGAALDAAIAKMNSFGHIIMCGLISDYNSVEPKRGPSLGRVITKRLRVQGFAMTDQLHRFGELFEKLGQYAQQGLLKYHLHTVHGLDAAPTEINRLFNGDHQGKLTVKL